MNKKLTLRMDDRVISEIKEFSKRHKTSVSKLTENLYQNLVEYEEKIDKVAEPITKKYKGIISDKKVNVKKIKQDYLTEKQQ